MPSIAIMEGTLASTLDLLASHPDICFDVKENLAYTEVATLIRDRESGSHIVPLTFAGVVLYSMWFESAVSAGFWGCKRIDFTHRVVWTNHLVQNLRKQRRLVSRLSRDVRHHDPESKPASLPY